MMFSSLLGNTGRKRNSPPSLSSQQRRRKKPKSVTSEGSKSRRIKSEVRANVLVGKVGSKGNASLRQQHDQQNNLLFDNDKEEEGEEDSVEELKTNCVSC